MPPRPFPLQLSIGTDIVHVNRIRDIWTKAEGKPQRRERFLRRFLTPPEAREFHLRFGNAWGADDQQRTVVSKHLAGRWAAKEAAIKAVTWRRISFHDVVIQRSRTEGRLQAVILDCDETIKAGKGSPLGDPTDEESAHAPSCSAWPLSLESRWSTNLVESIQGQIAKISISHDGEYATAVCLAAEELS